jgi:hypothetical protein
MSTPATEKSLSGSNLNMAVNAKMSKEAIALICDALGELESVCRHGSKVDDMREVMRELNEMVWMGDDVQIADVLTILQKQDKHSPGGKKTENGSKKVQILDASKGPEHQQGSSRKSSRDPNAPSPSNGHAKDTAGKRQPGTQPVVSTEAVDNKKVRVPANGTHKGLAANNSANTSGSSQRQGMDAHASTPGDGQHQHAPASRIASREGVEEEQPKAASPTHEKKIDGAQEEEAVNDDPDPEISTLLGQVRRSRKCVATVHDGLKGLQALSRCRWGAADEDRIVKLHKMTRELHEIVWLGEDAFVPDVVAHMWGEEFLWLLLLLKSGRQQSVDVYRQTCLLSHQARTCAASAALMEQICAERARKHIESCEQARADKEGAARRSIERRTSSTGAQEASDAHAHRPLNADDASEASATRKAISFADTDECFCASSDDPCLELAHSEIIAAEMIEESHKKVSTVCQCLDTLITACGGGPEQEQHHMAKLEELMRQLRDTWLHQRTRASDVVTHLGMETLCVCACMYICVYVD